MPELPDNPQVPLPQTGDPALVIPAAGNGLFTGHGLDDKDLTEQLLVQEEQFLLFFPKIVIKRIDRDKTQVDRIRGEPKAPWGALRKRPPEVGKRFLAPISYPAYAAHEPQQNILLKYGIDEPRECVFTFLLHMLQRDKVEVRIGDVLVFQNQDFEVLEARNPTESYWINTPYPFYLLCACNLYRTEGDRQVDYGGR